MVAVRIIPSIPLRQPASRRSHLKRASVGSHKARLTSKRLAWYLYTSMPPRPRKTPRPVFALPPDDDAFVRLDVVLSVFPIGETSWWKGVAEGRYPPPVKLTPRVNAWRVGTIRALLASYAGTDNKPKKDDGS